MLPLPLLFSQNHSIKTMRKPFSLNKKKYANFVLIIPLRRAKIKHNHNNIIQIYNINKLI